MPVAKKVKRKYQGSRVVARASSAIKKGALPKPLKADKPENPNHLEDFNRLLSRAANGQKEH